MDVYSVATKEKNDFSKCYPLLGEKYISNYFYSLKTYYKVKYKVYNSTQTVFVHKVRWMSWMITLGFVKN